jgi:transcriptional regulator with PAS, ATPase and Fis domain
MAMVRMSAQMIENRLFNVHFIGDFTLRFHTRPELIGTLWEGIAVFSSEGRLLAVNRSGAFQLGLNEQKSPGIEFGSLFDISLPAFLDQTRNKQISRLGLANGLQISAKADVRPATVAPGKQSSTNRPEDRTLIASPLDDLDTGDAQMRQIIATARLSIDHDIPMLIEGETGTGKELLAKAMHQSSRRKNGAFVAINCASIPEGLIEAELFGHEEGAFTGARRRGAVGRIQQAHGGTLFLDEIGEMPLALQARLLRVIQEREVVPLGSNKAINVDVAIISATNCHLRERVMQGGFREDLYYRLNGLRLSLPALRERSDLVALIGCILKKQLNKRSITIHPEVVQLMQRHPWHGNIRQLRNVLRSSMIFMQGNQLELEHLPQDFLEELKSERPSAKNNMENDNREFEQADIASNEAALIRHVLAQHGGNMTAAAGHLGISRATVYRKAKRLGLR